MSRDLGSKPCSSASLLQHHHHSATAGVVLAYAEQGPTAGFQAAVWCKRQRLAAKCAGSRSQWQSTSETQPCFLRCKSEVWPREMKESKEAKSVHTIVKQETEFRTSGESLKYKKTEQYYSKSCPKPNICNLSNTDEEKTQTRVFNLVIQK